MVFCFLGILGNCGSFAENKSLIENQTNVMHDYIFKKVSNFLGNIQASVSNFQNIMAEASGDIIIEGIKMKQYAEVTSETEVNISNMITEDNVIDDLINIMAKENLKAEAKSSFFQRSTRSMTNSETKMVTEIKKQVKDIITVNTVINCISNIISKQQITAKSSGGSVIIRGIEMEQSSKLMAQCAIKAISDVISKVKISDKLLEDIKKEQEATSKTTMSTLLNLLWILLMVFLFGIPAIIILILIFRFMRRPSPTVVSKVKVKS
jgi:hypothetical protein